MPESSSGNARTEREKKIAQVTRDLRALLISAPSGLNVIEVQNDYQSIIGKPFPYRELGYKSALELLQALPDVVVPTYVRGQLILRGVIDEKSQRVASLIARQKKVSKRRATRVIVPRPLLPPVVPAYVRAKIKEVLSFYPSGLLGSSFLGAYERHSNHMLDWKKLGFSSLSELLRSIPNLVQIEPMKNEGFRVRAVEEEKPDVRSKVNFGSISSRGPFSRPSYSSSSMLESDLIDTKKEVSASKKLENLKTVLDSQSSVSKSLRREISKILNMRPNGVWSGRLPVEYKKMFKKDLVVRDHGFTSVIELADAMPDILKIERPTKTGDWLLLSNQKGPEKMLPESKPSPVQTTRQEQRVLQPSGPGRAVPVRPDIVAPGRPSSSRTLPVADGVGLGVYYPKLTVPETGYVDVYVTHTSDPHDFWIMLIGNYPKLEALAEDIRLFYNSSEGMSYLMPDWYVAVGQVCCALYEEDGAWYRALITSFNSIHSIEVFYVDYGNRSRVALHNLRILRSSFIKLPAQAIHAQLAYIKPAKVNEWSPGSCHRFYHITKDFKPLVGLFCGMKDDKISVCLCDTSQVEDLHINDELVEEGYAVFNPPTSPPPALSPRESNKQEINPPPGLHHAPGLPLPSAEQQFFNSQFIPPAGQMSAVQQKSEIPDLPMHFNVNYNNDILSLLNAGPTKTEPCVPTALVSQENVMEDTVRTEAEGQDADASQDELAFMEEICNELEESSTEECILKRICLMGICTIHIINHEKKPYVTSADISALFWDSDSLRTMLRQKKLTVPKALLSREENGGLLDELVRCGVRGTMDGESPRDFVTIYEFQSLPRILKTFNHPSEELLTRVLAEIEHFDKEGEAYWLIKDEDDSESTGTESSQDEGSIIDAELALEELKLVVQAMQFRRKRIIQSLMTSEGAGAGSSVDDLLQVESKIETLKKELERRQNEEDEAIPDLVKQDQSKSPTTVDVCKVEDKDSSVTKNNTRTVEQGQTTATRDEMPVTPPTSAPPPKEQPRVTPRAGMNQTRSYGVGAPAVLSTSESTTLASPAIDTRAKPASIASFTPQVPYSNASSLPLDATVADLDQQLRSLRAESQPVAPRSYQQHLPKTSTSIQQGAPGARSYGQSLLSTAVGPQQFVQSSSNLQHQLPNLTYPQAPTSVPAPTHLIPSHPSTVGVPHAPFTGRHTPPFSGRPPLLPDPPLAYSRPMMAMPVRAPPGMHLIPAQQQVQLAVFGGGRPPLVFPPNRQISPNALFYQQILKYMGQ